MNTLSSRTRWALLCTALCVSLFFGARMMNAAAEDEPPKPTPISTAAEIDAAWTAWAALPTTVHSKVDPRILAELRGEVQPVHLSATTVGLPYPLAPLAQTRFIVLLQEQGDLSALDARVYASALDQRNAIVTELTALAERTQSPLRAMLNARQQAGAVRGYQPFSVVNALAVEGDLATLSALAQRADVARIVGNYPLVPLWDDQVIASSAQESVAPAQTDAYPWNMMLTGVDRVWNELSVRGDGAVVGGFDTGVTFEHPALVRAYRGYLGQNNFDHNYNWFEPDGKLYTDGSLGRSASNQPYDCDYSTHGTHTMGTMIGDGGSEELAIGVAPGARWIAIPGICGRTMPGLSLSDDIGGLKAFQWFLCPTDLTGNLSTADCSKAPDVINNSWGSANPTVDIFQPALQALRQAGTTVVFAAGNTGRPGSIGSPGHLPEALTVGAVDVGRNLAYFSSQGPAFHNLELKPNLSAPGVEVLSSVLNSMYMYGSGTSMAAPHVAGLVALLVSADLKDGVRDFGVDEIESFILSTVTDQGLIGGDYFYGEGVMDAFNAVRWLLSSGELTGVIADAQSGQPIAGVQILGRNLESSDTFSSTTDSQGFYSLSVPAGRYALTLSHPVYEKVNIGSQRVLTGSLSTANFQLLRRATASLTGTVVDDNGVVTDAHIRLTSSASFETRSGPDGKYALTVPVGSHTVIVEARGHKYFTALVNVTSAGGRMDVRLTRAPTILLVSADASAGWFFGWPVHAFFADVLTEHGYLYDLWQIEHTTFTDRSPLIDGSLGYGIPSAATLLAYDVVIWVHSGCNGYGYLFDCSWSNPGAIGADEELMEFLDGGGRLLISGQDIGRMDGDLGLYDNYLKADLLTSSSVYEGSPISGLEFLNDLSFEITNASLYGSSNSVSDLSPDGVDTSGGAFSVLRYADTGQSAALAVAPCAQDYRAVYFAMGYENIARRADLQTADMSMLIPRTIDWLMNADPVVGFHLSSMSNQRTGETGVQLTYLLLLENFGPQPLDVSWALHGQTWPVSLEIDGQPVPPVLRLDPCSTRQLQVSVHIPADAEIDARDTMTFTVTANGMQLPVQEEVFVTTAAPEWHPGAPSAAQRFATAAVTLPERSRIYVVGGYDGNSNLSDHVEAYDPCEDRWTSLAALPEPLAFAQGGGSGNQIYVAGGAFADSLSDKLWIYDADANTWRNGTPLPVTLLPNATATWNNKLYIFGGRTANNDYFEILVYDPATDAWSTLGPLPEFMGVYGWAAATLNNEIYLLKTDSLSTGITIYNPTTNSWRTGSVHHLPRSGASLVAQGAYLYLVGGNVGGTTPSVVERYDPLHDEWFSLAPLIDRERTWAAIGAVEDRLAVIGGIAHLQETEVLTLRRNFCNSTIAATRAAVGAGDPFELEISLEPGVRAVDGVRVRAPLPAELTFRDFVQNSVAARYNASEHTIEWDGNLAALSPQAIRFSVSGAADAEMNTQYEGVARFSNASGRQFERRWQVTVLTADYSPSAKTASQPTLVEGERLTYTLAVRSATPIGGAVTLRDQVPAELLLDIDSLKINSGELLWDPDQQLLEWRGVLTQSVDAVINTTGNYIWGDSMGNGMVNDVAFDWQDIAATGKRVASGDDLLVCDIPLGFDFPFGTVQHRSLCVSTNGYIVFDSAYNWLSVPCPRANNGVISFIAGYGQDLIVDGGIYAQMVGSAPNRAHIFQWKDARRYGTDGVPTIDFQLILHESGNIDMRLLNTPAVRSSRTVIGLQAGQDRGVAYTCGERMLQDRLAVDFLADGQGKGGPSTEIQYAVQLTPALTPDLAANRSLTNTMQLQSSVGNYARSVGVLANPLYLNQSTAAVSAVEVAINQPFNYRFDIRNTGLVTGTHVELRDVLPPDVNYVADTLRCSADTCAANSNRIAWRGALAPGQSVTVEFSATVGMTVPDLTVITNTAYLNDGFGGITALSSTIRARQAEFSGSFVEVDPPIFGAGELISYTIYLRNSGGGPAVVDAYHELSVDMNYEPGTVWCGAGVCTVNGATIHWQGTLNPRVMVPVRVQARLADDLPAGATLTGTLVIQRQDRPVPALVSTQIQLAQRYFLTQLVQPFWYLFMPEVSSKQPPLTPTETPTPTPVPSSPLPTPTPPGG